MKASEVGNRLTLMPVNITANATYVASYHTTSGFYSFNGASLVPS
jgi:hypothetical protein